MNFSDPPEGLGNPEPVGWGSPFLRETPNVVGLSFVDQNMLGGNFAPEFSCASTLLSNGEPLSWVPSNRSMGMLALAV